LPSRRRPSCSALAVGNGLMYRLLLTKAALGLPAALRLPWRLCRSTTQPP
jgi:hypothetical protein